MPGKQPAPIAGTCPLPAPLRGRVLFLAGRSGELAGCPLTLCGTSLSGPGRAQEGGGPSRVGLVTVGRPTAPHSPGLEAAENLPPVPSPLPLPSLRTGLPRAPHTRGTIPYLSLGGRRLSSRSTHVLELRPGRSGVGAALVLKAESSPTARWSFLCRRTLGAFPPLGSRCRGHGWARVSPLQAPALSSSGDRPTGRGAGSQGNAVFSSLRGLRTVFHGGCTISRPHQQGTGFRFPRILVITGYSLLFWWHVPMGGRWDLCGFDVHSPRDQ